MKRTVILSLSLLCVLLAAVCCVEPLGPDDSGDEKPSRPQPEGYSELIRAYADGKLFDKAETTTTTTDIYFEDGTKISVRIDAMHIYDCRVAEPKVVSRNGSGMWMVGGTLTGVEYNALQSDASAYPVYVYYTRATLHMHLSNGSHIVFKTAAPVPAPTKKGAIPVVYIKTDGGKGIYSKETYVHGTIRIIDADSLYTDGTPFEAPMQIRGRGNSTWGMAKKPYRIKLDENAKVLGMKGNRDWYLLAEYADKSLLRNQTAMEISRICGFSWTPAMVSVELYLNNVYQGVYTFSQAKEIAKDRVNIEVATEKDNAGEALTGGYYLELEENQDEPVCWWSEHGAPFMFLAPERPTEAQQKYMKDYVSGFETALWGHDMADPEKGYAAWIDLPSFVNYYILQELTKNIDGNLRKSTFITKERGKKMEMYHVWDFDLTLGNCDYFYDVGNGPEGWWIKDHGSWGRYHGWYYHLFMDPAFGDLVRKRWKELLPALNTVPEFIDSRAALLGDAQKRNFKTWNILNQYVWPNYKIPGSYEGEIKWLKEFYTKRLVWMDQHIDEL